MKFLSILLLSLIVSGTVEARPRDGTPARAEKSWAETYRSHDRSFRERVREYPARDYYTRGNKARR